MSRYTAEAESGMKGITFPAWRGKHYVTLAELLVRLGSFGLDLTWRVELDEFDAQVRVGVLRGDASVRGPRPRWVFAVATSNRIWNRGRPQPCQGRRT
ncbi:hypothetical protein AB0A76_18615 [Streptomyces exfoliatus]|uniref:Uncharacterized protein n=1 Tax=Streptomyces exfoliatus TaxID=1905 RepID=A0ABV3D0G8_STREX